MVWPAPDLLYISDKWQPQGLTWPICKTERHCYVGVIEKKASPPQTSPHRTLFVKVKYSAWFIQLENYHASCKSPICSLIIGISGIRPSALQVPPCRDWGTDMQINSREAQQGKSEVLACAPSVKFKIIKFSFCKVLLSRCGFSYQSALDTMQVNTKFL